LASGAEKAGLCRRGGRGRRQPHLVTFLGVCLGRFPGGSTGCS